MRLAVPLLALVTLASAAGAQAVDSNTPGATNACFGFSFGRWTPPLDWNQAGHRAAPRVEHTDAGASSDGGRRSWAADQTEAGRVEMVLFPGWWPVGVHVKLAEVGGDTLRGTATALVADGRVAPPVARVAALRVPCGVQGQGRRVPPADDPPALAPADTARRAVPRPAPRAARRAPARTPSAKGARTP